MRISLDKIILLFLILGTKIISAQGSIGINTMEPNATFHIKSESNSGVNDKIFLLETMSNKKLFTALNNGNIGIGIEEPKYRLDVNGAGLRLKNDDAHTILYLSAPSNKFATINFIKSKEGLDKRRWEIGMNDAIESGVNGGSDFYIGSYDNNGDWMQKYQFRIVRGTGNVGIGKYPTEKLEVGGNVKADLFIALKGAEFFPDYVFENYYTGKSNIKSTYNFRSLEQVESFIKDNGHLPGYISAKKIKEQGYIDLTATQLINIEKIEELYLHTIEQAKEIAELKALVQDLLKKESK